MAGSLLALAAVACLAAAKAPAPPIDVRRAPSEAFEATVRFSGRTWRFDLYDVSFPSPLAGRFPANDTVWGTLYLPRRPSPPGVLLLPVMAAPNQWIEKRFAALLATEGFAVLQLELPFQFRRGPGRLVPSGQVFLARRAETLARNFAQAVLDARRAGAWLRRSGFVDPARVALVGVSLGALVGATTLSVDDRFAAGLLLLGGADFPTLILEGEMTSQFARRLGLEAEALRKAFAGLDPLAYREANRGKRVALVNVKNDLVIPLPNALKLKEAFPDAAQLLLPLGHYTALLHLLWMPAYAPWKLRGLLPE